MCSGPPGRVLGLRLPLQGPPPFPQDSVNPPPREHDAKAKRQLLECVTHNANHLQRILRRGSVELRTRHAAGRPLLAAVCGDPQENRVPQVMSALPQDVHLVLMHDRGGHEHPHPPRSASCVGAGRRHLRRSLADQPAASHRPRLFLWPVDCFTCIWWTFYGVLGCHDSHPRAEPGPGCAAISGQFLASQAPSKQRAFPASGLPSGLPLHTTEAFWRTATAKSAVLGEFNCPRDP